jgi:hypothetical protein
VSDISKRLEIADTLEILRREIDDLVVRGLRTAGPQDLAALSSLHEGLERVGASYLAQRVGELLALTRAGSHEAPSALMKLTSTLRVFERALTLDTAALLLEVKP